MHSDSLIENYIYIFIETLHENVLKWSSQKEDVKNLTSKWNQNIEYFFPQAARSLLCIWFATDAFPKTLSKRAPPRL